MNILEKAIKFLTDSSGPGFVFLMAGGLGAILYLMKYTTKEWKKEDERQKEEASKYKGPSFPYKPF